MEYSDNYLKTYGSLWQYYRGEQCLNNDAIADISADNNNSALFEFKTKVADKTKNNGTKIVKTMVPLKYFSNF